MSEENMLADVRKAKEWCDSQSESMQQRGERLRAVELAYQERSGIFARLPMTVPQSVRDTIEKAVGEPGRELLAEIREVRAR